jgi:anti-anti-sigma factor
VEAVVTRAGDVIVVSLKGFLNFETSDQFKKGCLTNFINKHVIFDLKELSFVGSSGLTSFVEVFREFKAKSSQPAKFCGLSQEFRRLFWASELQDIELYEDAFTAHASFTQPIPGTPIDFNLNLEQFEDDSN